MKILFVCLGNICRSPMAESVFDAMIKEKGLNYISDSAGTSAWHVGESADARSRSACEKHGVSVTSKSRKVKTSDFTEFDFILAMDKNNLRDLQSNPAYKKGTAVVKLLGEYDPEKILEVGDPYYGGTNGFEDNFQHIARSCKIFIEKELSNQ